MRLFILTLYLLVELCSSHKILVFAPTISRSHMITNGRIADTLAKAGHEVVMFEPDFLGIFDKVQAAKVARRWPVHNFTDSMLQVLQGYSRDDVFAEESLHTMNTKWGNWLAAFNEHCEDLINRDEVIEQLRAEKFDAFFGEQLSLCGNALAHALDIKSHFWVSSCSMSEITSWITGTPIPFSYAPVTFGVDMGSHPSYFERLNSIIYGVSHLMTSMHYNNELTNIFRRKFGPSFPPVDSIAADSDIIFVSTDEFIQFNRPLTPNTIFIGGLGLEDKNVKLDEEFETQMSKGPEGVVYFSLGTNVNTSLLPEFAMKAVIEMAKKFPKHHFIVKVDKFDKFAFDYGKAFSNVYVTSWAPQPALLADARLRVFITHAGYNGVVEAARAGVPLITMPFMFDQTINSRAIAERGWGLALKKQVLRDDPAQLEKAIGEMLRNKEYKKQALRIKNLVRNKPFNATERLVKWTEFVLDNGGLKELLVEGRNLNSVVYHNLDIFVPVVLLVLLIVYLVFKVFFYICGAFVIVQKPKQKKN